MASAARKTMSASEKRKFAKIRDRKEYCRSTVQPSHQRSGLGEMNVEKHAQR